VVEVSSGVLAVKFFYGGVEEIPKDGVRVKTFFSHIVFIFRLDVRRKRFSLHGKTISHSQQRFVRDGITGHKSEPNMVFRMSFGRNIS